MSTENEAAIIVKDVAKYFEPAKGHSSIKQVFTSVLRKKKKDKQGSKGYWALKNIDFEVKRANFSVLLEETVVEKAHF